MASLFDSPDATGNTQDMDTGASQGSTKRDGAGAEEQRSRRQLRRTASSTMQDGGASSSTMAVVAKPEADSKVEQKSLNTIILKAILNTHQTMRDPSSTVWETLLVKAPSPEAESFQKKTQTFSERYGKRDEATRGPDQVSSAEGQHCRHANGTICTGLLGPEGQRGGHTNSAGHFGLLGSTGTPSADPNLRRGPILQVGQRITLNIVSPE